MPCTRAIQVPCVYFPRGHQSMSDGDVGSSSSVGRHKRVGASNDETLRHAQNPSCDICRARKVSRLSEYLERAADF